MKVDVRDANFDEVPLLAMVVLESGAYGGPHHMTVEHQSVDTTDLARSHTRVATSNGQVSGFYSLVQPGSSQACDAELDFMFVHDRWRDNGIGRAMFADMMLLAVSLTIGGVHIVAHPPDEPFYRRMGAHRIGTQAARGRITWSRPVLHLSLLHGAGNGAHAVG